MSKFFFATVVFAFAVAAFTRADNPPKPPGKSRLDAALAEYTRKTKEANYPPLFEKAAAEFGVPADVLKGIAFADTRWEHVTWPTDDSVSPDTGLPRAFGIMSLWDNDNF